MDKPEDVLAVTKAFMEGVVTFAETLNFKEDNPYSDITDKRYLQKRYAWYEGNRAIKKYYIYEKYNIVNLQKEIRNLIYRNGLEIKYTDEYSTPYATTPEGYDIVIAEDIYK